MFIKIVVDEKKCLGIEQCGKCLKECPVDIFVVRDNLVDVDARQEDECMLCDVCLEACPVGAVRIIKEYE